MEKRASIDIGTNTVRLLISGVDTSANGAVLDPEIYDRAITRLGGAYTPEDGIDAESAERTIGALVEFARKVDVAEVSDLRAVATSVVRKAINGPSFLEQVMERTKIPVEVISGDEEARLSLLGVRSVVGSSMDRLLVFDIGGGSTEFIAAEGDDIAGLWSMDLGVVHLTEKHLLADPPKEAELAALAAEVAGVVGALKERMAASGVDPAGFSSENGAVLAGTAGTVTTLAAIDLDLAEYDAKLINNHTLTLSKIEEILKNLSALTLKDRESILALEKGREDLIIAGSVIALEVMRSFGFTFMLVSDAGLLEGVILAGLE